MIQKLVLHEEHGIVALGEIFRESEFSSHHLPAQEHQLR